MRNRDDLDCFEDALNVKKVSQMCGVTLPLETRYQLLDFEGKLGSDEWRDDGDSSLIKLYVSTP
jgi:hypothetical protein